MHHWPQHEIRRAALLFDPVCQCLDLLAEFADSAAIVVTGKFMLEPRGGNQGTASANGRYGFTKSTASASDRIARSSAVGLP